MTKVKPHTCMADVEQRGNYLHCNDGNHGMRLPAGVILNRVNGQWVFEPMVVRDPDVAN